MPPSPRPRDSLSLPKLYAIVDVELCERAGRLPLDVARAFLSAGTGLIQLRAKTWDSGAFLDLAHAMVEEARAAGARMVVNDRADVAALAGAHGLHVGQDDLSPGDARQVVGPASWLGLSTHTEAQWVAALDEPVSYLAIGPVFGTGTKATGHDAVGLETVRRAARAAAGKGLPLVAIGGISLERAPSVIASGASAVAVISGLLDGSPEARAREFIRALS